MTINSIPASAIVNVTPSVLGAGGTALDLNGVILTNSTRVPVGSSMQFSSAANVASFFGPTSTESILSNIYFQGFVNSTVKPGAILFSQYPIAPVSAYLRGGSVAGMTLTQLQAVTGTLVVVIDGVTKTAASFSLASASSFSNAASLIATALTTTGLVAYDSQSGSFVITSGTTGGSSTLAFATGTMAPLLNFTQATGAVLSQGSVAATPVAAMTAFQAQNTNWASFMTTFEPSASDKVQFATWASDSNDDYVYCMWDTDVTATQQGNTTSAGVQINNLGLSGTVPIYQDINVAAFLMGAIASVNFAQRNGRVNFAFKSSQGGILPSVTNRTIGDNLIANGYNFYASYATAAQAFQFFYPGQVSGNFDWLDSYVDQIWMNNQFQLALMELLTQVFSVPYNVVGYAMIEASVNDVIQQALVFGAIRPGVTLSSLQVSEVNASAGVRIDNVLNNRGWYFQVVDASPQVRVVRGSPPCTFWYMDGGSINKINLSSIEVQ